MMEDDWSPTQQVAHPKTVGRGYGQHVGFS